MKAVRKNTFNNDIIFCDGHCNTGKSMISKIIEGFEGVEISKEDEQFEVTQEIYSLGKIELDAAIVLVQIWADRCLNYQMVGRQVNTRPDDVTTLYTYPYPGKYIKRMFDGERSNVTERINKEKPIYQSMTQNAVLYPELYFGAFGDRLKIIYIKRDLDTTVDAITSRGFGERIGTDPSDIVPTFEYKNTIVPFYAKEWPDDYINMTPRERIYRWVKQEYEMIDKIYEKNKYRKNVLFIDFEKFVKNPYPYLDKIGELIDRKQTNKMAEILVRERCPR